MDRSKFLKGLGTGLLFMPFVPIVKGEDKSWQEVAKEAEKRKGILFILVDPSMINMPDLLEIEAPELSGAPIVRYRKTEWGGNHPAIEIFSANKTTGISELEWLRESHLKNIRKLINDIKE